MEQSLINARSLGRGGPEATAAPVPARGRPEYLNELGMIFGTSYESSAVVPDGTPPPKVDNPITEYRPCARPGHRAPHAWLVRDGAQRSVLDLFGRRFVLLAGGGAWCEAARTAAHEHGVALDAFRAGADFEDPDDRWRQAWEIERGGAVLVRPDGQVAWRSRGEAPAAGADRPIRPVRDEHPRGGGASRARLSQRDAHRFSSRGIGLRTGMKGVTVWHR